MDDQKSAHRQHASHNLLCALVKFLYLSGPPLLGQPRERGGRGGQFNLLFPRTVVQDPQRRARGCPTKVSGLLLPSPINPKQPPTSKEPRDFSFEEALVVYKHWQPHPDNC